MYWYDICNDYSLDLRMSQKTPPDVDLFNYEEHYHDEFIFYNEDDEETYLLAASRARGGEYL